MIVCLFSLILRLKDDDLKEFLDRYIALFVSGELFYKFEASSTYIGKKIQF